MSWIILLNTNINKWLLFDNFNISMKRDSPKSLQPLKDIFPDLTSIMLTIFLSCMTTFCLQCTPGKELSVSNSTTEGLMCMHSLC